MDFRLTDQQVMLFETLSAMLGKSCTGADLRRLLEANQARDADRWRSLVNMGLPGLLVSEAQGGVGLGTVEMVLVAMACGRVALPEPIVEHAGIAVPILAATADAWLARAIAGETIAVGHPANPFVADADTAAAILMIDEQSAHLVSADDVDLRREDSIDPFRRLFHVAWSPGTGRCLASGPKAAMVRETTFDRGALLSAAQLIGLGQRAIDLSVTYAMDRHQFGRPIGAFQAVKHQLATAQTKIEFARPVVFAAAAMMEQRNPSASVRVSHAKIAAAEAADVAVHAAVQIHGAMGYSWEVDVHFLLKRILALSGAWGTSTVHRHKIGGYLQSARLGPDRTFLENEREAILDPA